MLPETADILCRITSDFYRAQAASFSQSRQAPWPGWDRVADRLARLGAGASGIADTDAESTAEQGRCCRTDCTGSAAEAALRILDLGCGNLRFETFLAEALPQRPCEFFAVDSCAGLLRDIPAATWSNVHFQELDAVAALAQAPAGALQTGQSADAAVPAQSLEAPVCDAAVAFGLLHHVPMFERRVSLLRALVPCVRPGGLVCVSLWRFMENPHLADKARALQPQALDDAGLNPAALDRDDYLLGWNGEPGVYRYCHHFADPEIDALADALAPAARVVDRFVSDGRSNDLNAYLVLQVR